MMSSDVVVPAADVTLRDARRVIEAGEYAARSAGLFMHLVVLDVHGNLVAHARMDGTWDMAAGSSIEAGLVRRAIDMAMLAVKHGASQAQRFFSVSHRAMTRRTIVIAAEPLLRNGLVAGAIGISGLSGEHDLVVAPAAAKVFP
jgi:uncharacterized protein GlcG (DUF336 family)